LEAGIRRISRFLITGSLLVVAVPGQASAAKPKDACHRAAAAPAATVLARSGAAVVFTRKDEPYGCAYKTAKVHRLETCCTDLTFKVAGVYAGYAAAGSAIGDEFTKLGVFNLRTGKLRAIRKLAPDSEGAGREIDTGAFVTAWRLSSAGDIAWIQPVRHDDGTLGPEQQLRAGAGTRPWERIVDTGTIAKLRLVDGRLRWTNQGVERATGLDDGPYRGHCDTVKGKQVLRTGALRIVKIPSHQFDAGTEFVGSLYLGCALPAGSVHQLGIAGTTYLYDNGHRVGIYGAETQTFTKPAGDYVLHENTSGSNSFTYASGDVLDLASGVSSDFMYYLDDQSGEPQAGTVPTSDPLSTVLSSTGAFAGVFDTDAGEHLVMALTPLGARRDLDTAAAASIPASSLAVAGSTVSWTNTGAPKSATVADESGSAP
jgi:hypothetical protein